MRAPENRIGQNTAHTRMEIGRVGFMAGTEVERAPYPFALANPFAGSRSKAFRLAPAHRPAQPGREILPAEWKKGLEHHAQRRRRLEGRAIHLLLLERERLYALGDRMP